MLSTDNVEGAISSAKAVLVLGVLTSTSSTWYSITSTYTHHLLLY